MHAIEVGTKRSYSKDMPQFPMMDGDADCLIGVMPPHEIAMYLQSPTHFLVMQNGRSSGRFAFDSDAMRQADGVGGEYMLGRAGQEYAYQGRSRSGVTVVHFSDAFLKRLDVPGGAQAALRNARPLGEDPQLHHMMTALRMSLEEDATASLYRRHLASAVILRLLAPRSKNVAAPAPSPSPKAKAAMRRAEEYLRANLCENVSLDDVAEAAGMSSAYFWKSFKAWKGVTPHAFLKELRLNKARRLLRETDMSVLRIAFDCGYNHQSHFGQAFKTRFGLSPVQYRRSAD